MLSAGWFKIWVALSQVFCLTQPLWKKGFTSDTQLLARLSFAGVKPPQSPAALAEASIAAALSNDPDATAAPPGGDGDAAALPPAPPSVEDWPVGDDFLLKEAVEAGAALGAVVRFGVLPFSRAYMKQEITERWRTLLYDPTVARPAAKRLAQHILDNKPTLSVLEGPEFEESYRERVAIKAKEAAAAAGPNGDAAAAKNEGEPAGAAAARDGAGKKRGREGAAKEGEEANGVSDPPWFAEAEQCLLDLPPRPAAAQVNATARKKARQELAASMQRIRRLEASAQAATARAATAHSALAILQGTNTQFYLSKREMVLGRSTDDQKVDVDLTEEGNASKVSRQQAFIKLRWNGEFCLRNVGRRPVWINNVPVESGHRSHLAPHSLIEVGGMRLLFLPNPTLVRAVEPEPV